MRFRSLIPTVAVLAGLLIGAAPAQGAPCADATVGAADLERRLADPGGDWLGADLSQSVDLGDGRTLWMYGDTFRGERASTGFRAGWTIARNSALVQRGACVSEVARHGSRAWVDPPAEEGGYLVIDNSGGVFVFGSAEFRGSVPELRARGARIGRSRVVGGFGTDGGDGYVLVDEDGGVFVFGSAEFHGSVPGLRGAGQRIGRSRVVGGAAAVDGEGYTLFDEHGGVFPFGSADYHGSVPGLRERGQPIGNAKVVAAIPVAAPSGRFLWPGDGYVHGDTLTVFFLEMEKRGAGFLDVAQTGIVRARFSARDLRLHAVERAAISEPGRTWGSSVIVDGGWAYAYGWEHRSPRSYLARFRPASPSAPWEFWNGEAWTGDPSAAAPVLSYGLWNNVTFSAHPDGGFVAVAKDHGRAGTDVLAWRAPRPEGPWEPLGAIATVADGPEEISYGAVAHTGVGGGSELLLSWNVNAERLAPVVGGRVRYGPRFATVTIPAA